MPRGRRGTSPLRPSFSEAGAGDPAERDSPGANILAMVIGGRRRKRGGGPGWGTLLLIGLALAGGYLLVQTRLGNGLTGVLSANATPLPTLTPTRSIEDFAKDGDTAYEAGDYKSAIALYEQALRRRPNDVGLHLKVARLFVFTGRAAAAEQRAARALQLDPSSAEAKATVCMALDWQARYSEAMATCQEAVAMNPSSSAAHAYLAEAQADTGDIRGAIASAQRALELDPRNVDAMRNIGYAYEQAGNYAQAIVYYDRALAMHPNLVHVLVGIGRAYTLTQVGKAQEYFRRAIRLDPQNAEAHDRLGGVYSFLGERELARQSLDKALEIEPNRVTAMTKRGALNLQSQLYEDAVLDYTRAFSEAQAQKVGLMAADYLNFGIALQSQSLANCPKAAPMFQQAAALIPADDDWQKRVRTYQLRCGR